MSRPLLEVVEGDLTRLDVDAIVNAANEALAPGGGVCGAIHRAAGPGLAAECARLGGCPTGEARITGGHGLKARHVIHAVGPVWHGGGRGEAELLAGCYRHALRLTEQGASDANLSMAHSVLARCVLHRGEIEDPPHRFVDRRATGDVGRHARDRIRSPASAMDTVTCSPLCRFLSAIVPAATSASPRIAA